MTRVLVVDDEPAVRFAVSEVLSERGYEVVEASEGREAVAQLGEVDVVVTDLAMPGLDGLAVLREARRAFAGLPVILLTARGSERAAVEAMKAGAHDYLAKPFDIDELAHVVANAAEASALRRAVRRAAAESNTGRALIGDSPPMRALLGRVERLAPRDMPVLVRGETGTGKEIVASLLHGLGAHPDGPLVRFNCAAIPAELADAELFGHAKGAFTGASQSRLGYFARADRGTLVLDEVGELPLAIQAKLLRAVQEGEVQTLGGDLKKVEVRIVACTHRDLRTEVKAGRFREDLLFRLAVVEIEVPPLRDRRQDIPFLVRAFLGRFNAKWGLDVRFTPELMKELTNRPWPGNVRELENVVARLVAEADSGLVGASATENISAPIPVASIAETDTLPFRTKVDAYERRLISEALTLASGNRAEAARRLGLSRVTLLDRMKRLGVTQ